MQPGLAVLVMGLNISTIIERKSSIRKLKQDVKAYELGELPPEEFNRKYESRKGHLGHADTYHIAKAVEYELLFYEWERLEATA